MNEEPGTSPPDSPIRQPMPRRLLTWAIIGAVLLPVTVVVMIIVYRHEPQLKRKPRGWFDQISSFRSIAAAQNTWRQNDLDGNDVKDYARRYRMLYYQPDSSGRPVALIDKALADASGPGGVSEAGYLFADITGDANGPYDYRRQFGFCAWPATYGRSGKWTYITSAKGIIYRKDAGGKPVTTWPKDLEKEGWEIVR